MTTLAAVRKDFADNPPGMVSFQRAFVIYLLTQGYKDFRHTLTIDGDGYIVCTIDPDLNDTQKAGIQNRLDTLHDVTIIKTDSGLEYIFT